MQTKLRVNERERDRKTEPKTKNETGRDTELERTRMRSVPSGLLQLFKRPE